jgi:hypothetical protein
MNVETHHNYNMCHKFNIEDVCLYIFVKIYYFKKYIAKCKYIPKTIQTMVKLDKIFSHILNMS